jgi:cell division septal protein FtsQ
MSREGRLRRLGQTFGMIAGIATLAAVAWAGWQVVTILQNSPRLAAVSEDAVPIGDNLTLASNGVLNKDTAWLKRALALPKSATLMGLDLRQAQERIEASGQVASVTLVRKFPATLSVIVSERTPVARVMAQVADGSSRTLLVSRDGTVYQGVDYDPAMVAGLPWLDGVKLVQKGRGLAPIAGMQTVADLLVRAKLEADQMYPTWAVVSLEHLQSDGHIEVRTRNGYTIIFGTGEDFFLQLARLDTLLDKISQEGGPAARAALRQIDLSLGARPNSQEVDVPVKFATVAAQGLAQAPSGPGADRGAALSDVAAFPNFQLHPP